MKKIEVLGTGCAKCNKLLAETEAAARDAGISVPVTKIEAIEEIMQRGVMTTPALVIDGRIMCSGRIPARTEITGWLRDTEQTH